MTAAALSHAKAAIDVLAKHYAAHARLDDAIGHELTEVLEQLGHVSFVQGELRAGSHPVSELLNGVLPSRNGSVADVLTAFHPLFAALPWRYGYVPRPDFPGLENRMAWAELVGPLAPFHSDKICLGITFIGAHTCYPEHTHPAVESYYVLSGTAHWTAAGVTQQREPGSLILHPSNITHVMETGDEPLIAAYTWSGDIVAPSIYAGSPESAV